MEMAPHPPHGHVVRAPVFIHVFQPTRVRRASLMVYPRRLGDIVVYFTPPGLEKEARHRDEAREILWVPNGLESGQALLIREKATRNPTGFFAEALIQHPTPVQASGPVLREPERPNSIWRYEIILIRGEEVLAYLDPEVVVSPDP